MCVKNWVSVPSDFVSKTENEQCWDNLIQYVLWCVATINAVRGDLTDKSAETTTLLATCG